MKNYCCQRNLGVIIGCDVIAHHTMWSSGDKLFSELKVDGRRERMTSSEDQTATTKSCATTSSAAY